MAERAGAADRRPGSAAAQRIDAALVAAWLALMLFGLVMVVSAGAGQSEGSDSLLGRQLLFVCLGAVAFVGVAALPLSAWEKSHQLCLLAAIALSALTLVPGVGVEVNGARRWIELGFFRVQPAELAKLLALVYLAGHLARGSAQWPSLLKPLAWTALLVLLVLAQRDFGSIVVLSVLAGGLLFLGGARLRDLGAMALALAAMLALFVVLQPYRVERLRAFLDPWSAQSDGGYQLTQALIAFGRGEFLGLGLGEGVQKLIHLPEGHNDFIYAVVAEELGLVGALALLALLGFLALRMFAIARRASVEGRAFAGLVAYGAALLLGVQTLINVGVNTGVLPTKGLTLPLVSFGGNSLLVCSALVALAVRANYESRGGAAHAR